MKKWRKEMMKKVIKGNRKNAVKNYEGDEKVKINKNKMKIHVTGGRSCEGIDEERGEARNTKIERKKVSTASKCIKIY